MEPIRDLILRLRASGLTQSEISRRTGISQPKLSRWEAGKVPASVVDAIRLSQLADEVRQASAASGGPELVGTDGAPAVAAVQEVADAA